MHDQQQDTSGASMRAGLCPSPFGFRNASLRLSATSPAHDSKPFACIAFDGDLLYSVLRVSRAH
jgi:hypothetical protein